jgi:hypothetical protein
MPGQIGWKWGCRGIEEDGEGGEGGEGGEDGGKWRREALVDPTRFVRYFFALAEVVELVDALRSGRSGRKPVRVRVPPSALFVTLFSALSVLAALSASSAR